MVRAAREQLQARSVSNHAVDNSTSGLAISRKRMAATGTGPKLAHALKRLRGAGDKPQRLSKTSRQDDASVRRTEATQDGGQAAQQEAEDSSEEELMDVVPDGAYDLLLGALRAEQGRNAQPQHLTRAGVHKAQSSALAGSEQTAHAVKQGLETSHASTEVNPAVTEPVANVKQDSKRARKQRAGNKLVATEAADGAALEVKSGPRKRAKIKDEEQEVAASRDTLAAQFDRELGEGEATALAASRLSPAENPAFASAWPDAIWMTTGAGLPQVHSSLEQCGVLQRLISLWREAHPGVAAESGESQEDFVSEQQKAFFALCSSYKDVLYPQHAYPTSVGEADPLMDAALLHCLNHVAKTAQRIKKNNDRLKANPDEDVPRDQGFTRPKVIILLPLRSMALRVVLRLVQLSQRETRTDSVQHKQRFLEDFGAEEDEAAEGERKPWESAEHATLFAGNSDDHFRIGIKLTRGAVRLFSDFFQSDIIVASPIALATKQGEADKEGPGELDFLSSIEIVLADRCDMFLMQNWAHVSSVFEALNKVPEEMHGTDVMRVREWYLTDQAKDFRQNILLSSFVSPEMNALFSRLCRSHAGKAKLQPKYKGVLGSIVLQVRQLFERIPGHSAANEADTRFEHFRKRVWPRIRDSGSGGQMIFVPSYLDYVRLRKFLRKQEVEFEGLSEYASGSEVARGRARFAAGKTRIALYTERAYFYHRRRTKGVKDLHVYQLPEHAHFYADLVGLLAVEGGMEAEHATVTVLFSRFDALRLERVVGSVRSAKMLKAASSTFMFC